MAGSTTGKAPADFYKDLIRTDRSNAGLSTSSTPERIVDGLGNDSALMISQEKAYVKPSTTNSTTSFVCQDKDANNILKVDTTNGIVYVNKNQQVPNTQYRYLGQYKQGVADNTWTALSTIPTIYSNLVATTFGTSSTPATTLTIASTSDDVTPCFWYVPDEIYVQSVQVFVGADGSTGSDDLSFALYYYTVDTANGATGGDLTAGTQVAISSSAIGTVGHDAIDFQSLSMGTQTVPAGKVLLGMFKNNGDDNLNSVNMTVKYYIK